jgi:hypothetical protein
MGGAGPTGGNEEGAGGLAREKRPVGPEGRERMGQREKKRRRMVG